MSNGTFPEVITKYFPGGYFGYDRDGRPVFIEPLGQVDFYGILHAAKIEDVVNYKREICEKAKQLCEDQEKKSNKELIRYSTLVLDAEGGGRKHLWKPGIVLYQTILKMYEDEFPNLREQIIVINTPYIFPIIFALIKPFLSQKTKDKIKVLGSSWKTDILKYIAADNLPEHYGGTCKDDNGSPKCEQYICYGGDIPKDYYVLQNLDKEKFDSAIVKASEKLIISRAVEIPNTRIRYQFITSDHDIGFSVELDVTDGNNEIVVPQSRKSSNLILEEGEIMCEKPGTYNFIFDNSYSWLREKEIFYIIQVIDDEVLAKN